MVKSNCLKEDLLNVCNSSQIDWDSLKGKTVLVTGASGLIGSLLSKSFVFANEMRNLNLTVLAMVRNLDKAKAVFEGFEDDCLQFVVGDVNDVIEVDNDIHYIFHCASVTTSKTMISNPVETLKTSVNGTFNLLELATKKQPEAFVFVSSMEMYGTFKDRTEPVTEDDIGYINPLAVRSNYPESKRLCENMCIAYLSEYGVHTRIARLAQSFGAGILPSENRVFAQFARSVINEENIVLHTQGLSEGNYCYTTDTVKGLIMIALKGKDGEAYSVVNPDTHTSIRDMALMVVDKFGTGKSQVIFDIPETNTFGYAADTKMTLSGDKLKSLGWTPEYNLEMCYARLIDFIKETTEE